MALSTHVTDRYGTNPAWLRNLTRQDDDDAQTVDSVRLGLATDAAEADFPLYAQEAYVDTDEAHIQAGVAGTIAYLRMWSTAPGKETPAIEAFHKKLSDIRAIRAGKRITPIAVAPAAREGDEDLFLGVTPENPSVDSSP